MLADAAAIALAIWFLAWALSFWYKTEPLRERVGVYLVYGEDDEPIDRMDKGGLSSWVNCPMCTAVAVTPAVLSLYFLFRPAVVCLAGMGLSLILIRWWEGAREKARWWL